MGTTSYAEFLAAKTRAAGTTGRPCDPTEVNPTLHDWQRQITAWAVRRGRAALWEDTGLGKTFQQVEWARLSGRRPLIVAPLSVCQQTVREAAKLGVDICYVRDDDPAGRDGIRITNYELADRFDPTALDAMVLDESSILKQADGKTRTMLIRHFAPVPRRLACSATPAPNDMEELTSQAEFLGIMPRAEMLAAYFVHDPATGWRLKGHARGPMFRWMSTWAVAIRRPSDLGAGYSDDGYVLPGLDVRSHLLPVDVVPEGQLFATDLGGVGGQARIRKQTLDARCGRVAELVAAEPAEPWVLWCDLNAEADRLVQLIPGAINVPGTWSPEDKAAALLDFAAGRIRVLVTKPSIASQGLNWQHCARMAFTGLGHSYEKYYQAIRRCYRYGQQRVVQVHIVTSELEGQIAANVRRKETEAGRLTAELVAAMHTTRNGVAA